MSGKISVNDVLINIQTAAKKHGVRLTYSNSKVYLKMLEYTGQSECSSIEDSKGVRFNSTTLDLAEFCEVSPRIITETLRKFVECGLIKYTVNHPNPSTILMYRQFFE